MNRADKRFAQERKKHENRIKKMTPSMQKREDWWHNNQHESLNQPEPESMIQKPPVGDSHR